MPRKYTISPTKLRLYQECPAQYRLEYIEKLGRFYHKARAGFSFGHTLHRALEEYHAAGGATVLSAEQLEDSLRTLWVAQGYESKEQEVAFQAEGVQILQQYHAAQVAALERSAEPDAVPEARVLYSEKTLRMDLSPNLVLTGRVDRVDEHPDGALEIVDYKSGRRTVTEADVAGALAMNLYQLLLKNLHPERRVFATIVALRSGDTASHEQTAEEARELKAFCTDLGETIRNKDWESVTPTPCDHCDYCDFLPYCQKFWKRQERGD
jgi:RecB family exonuclease